jgi:hypothetical protein
MVLFSQKRRRQDIRICQATREEHMMQILPSGYVLDTAGNWRWVGPGEPDGCTAAQAVADRVIVRYRGVLDKLAEYDGDVK